MQKSEGYIENYKGVVQKPFWRKLLRRFRKVVMPWIIAIYLITKKGMSKKDKFIKRCIKNPEKAKCRKCGSSMKYHATSDAERNFVEMFMCNNDKCGMQYPINRVKREKKKKQQELHIKKETPEIPVKKEPRIDTENTVFEMINQKVHDKYYAITETLLYNPITCMLMEGRDERPATPDEQIQLSKYIQENSINE